MPVNDEPIIEEPHPYAERFFTQTRRAVGATDRIPLRIMALFIVIAVCTALAPIPANLVGVAAVALLALDSALHRR